MCERCAAESYRGERVGGVVVLAVEVEVGDAAEVGVVGEVDGGRWAVEEE